MDDETRQAARLKADAITDMIGIFKNKMFISEWPRNNSPKLPGYPKFILNPQELDELYGDLKIEANEYFLNNVRSNQFSLRQNLIKLNEPVNKTL